MKEEKRKLSEAEKRRLEKYEEISREMEEKGYQRSELLISIGKANLYVMLAFFPVFGLGIFAFLMAGHMDSFLEINSILFLIFIVVLTVVHELLHGLGWSLFTEHRFKDIEFGFMKESLTPYCTCKLPLKKGEYIIGCLLPLFALGILPFLFSLYNGSFLLLCLSLVMILSAGGDVMIFILLMRHRQKGSVLLCLDHPTSAGLAVFER